MVIICVVFFDADLWLSWMNMHPLATLACGQCVQCLRKLVSPAFLPLCVCVCVRACVRARVYVSHTMRVRIMCVFLVVASAMYVSPAVWP